MDELLRQEPRQLENERTELFALMDRFSASIHNFQKQYDSSVKRANADVNQRRK